MTLPNYTVNPGRWLGISIVSTMLCCLPLGVPGIVFAAMAMASEGRGDYAAAKREIAWAKSWITWSIGVGIAAAVVAACLYRSRESSDF